MQKDGNPTIYLICIIARALRANNPSHADRRLSHCGLDVRSRVNFAFYFWFRSFPRGSFTASRSTLFSLQPSLMSFTMFNFYSSRMIFFLWVFSCVNAAIRRYQAWKYLLYGRDMIREKAAIVRTVQYALFALLSAELHTQGWRRTILLTCFRLWW
jgi:hypothetical protein